jgi:hypothetical protein
MSVFCRHHYGICLSTYVEDVDLPYEQFGLSAHLATDERQRQQLREPVDLLAVLSHVEGRGVSLTVHEVVEILRHVCARLPLHRQLASVVSDVVAAQSESVDHSTNLGGKIQEWTRWSHCVATLAVSTKRHRNSAIRTYGAACSGLREIAWFLCIVNSNRSSQLA